MYSSSFELHEVKTALRYHDTFINCSVLSTTDVHPLWKYRNAFVNISNTNKYTQNRSGLIIHNVTDDDKGQYVCLILQLMLKAYITVNVICEISYICNLLSSFKFVFQGFLNYCFNKIQQ